MRTALIAALFSVLFLATAPSKPELDGICVVEFNADFNKQNSVPWIENLSECKHVRVNIFCRARDAGKTQDCSSTYDHCIQ